ncbi:amylo-alpha-1,6-glucosidase [Ferroplasma sp.]|uniref:amylo-alpha-1,6-glucosidase n=1 Tax=Ferroplasma sp. TaxID=2591003 RepID=UPI00307CCFD4
MDFNTEWLITNSSGSFSSSTVSFANTRTYHGLLVRSDPKTYNRYVLLSKISEEMFFSGKQYMPDTNYYEGAIWPEGYAHMQGYSILPFPEVTFNMDGNLLKKSVVMDPDSDTIAIRYKFLNRIPEKINFYPLLAFRNFHNTLEGTDKTFAYDESVDSYDFTDGKFKIKISKFGKFINKSYWYYNFRYPVEEERGTNSMENLYMPGIITAENIENPLDIIITAEENNNLTFPEIMKKLKMRGINRRKDHDINRMLRNSSAFLLKDDFIAGFHWFGPWARDTFISMPGLILINKNFEMARKILTKYANSMKGNIIPNNSYNQQFQRSADASLWFIYALYKYYKYSHDKNFIASLYCKLESLVNSYINGNEDFSLDHKFIVVKNAQMTWMDAKTGNKAFTPRLGKPVEINALWYNALKSLEYFSGLINRKINGKVADIISGFKDEFNKRYIVNNQIADVIDPLDLSFRPNFLLAYSLPFPLMDDKRFLEEARQKLVTPYGLRTLSPDSDEFAGKYSGNQYARDRAYHNGTVWPWLSGPYITACVRNGYSGSELYRYFSPLYSMEMLPEIFDGIDPEGPKGCIMQAWSYGELIRAYYEDIHKAILNEGKKQ